MAYRDELVRCAACGNQFVFTVREQRARAAKGLPREAPVFCSDCRAADVRLSGSAREGDGGDESTGGAVEAEVRHPPAVRPKAGDGGKQFPAGERRAAGPRPARTKGRSRRSDPPVQTELRVRQLGTVKWFDDDRGFGFIAPEDGDELFVHSTAVLTGGSPPLVQGQQVEYEVARTPRGPQAVDVVPLG